MNKSLKVLLISLVFVFSIFCTSCFAVNIEMNLTSDLSSNTTSSYDNTLLDDDFDSNIDSSNIVDDFDDIATYDNTIGTSNTSTTPSTSSTTKTNTNTSEIVHALPESELGLTNVLNILLIAVGLVLILLSIAIFIRLKK